MILKCFVGVRSREEFGLRELEGKSCGGEGRRGMGTGKVVPGIQRQGWMMWLGCLIIANPIVVGHGSPATIECRLRVGSRAVEDERQRLLGSRVGSVPVHDEQMG